MPSSVHSQDQDQSMMDAAPQEQEQYQEEDDLLEMEEKRIVVVRLPWLRSSYKFGHNLIGC